MVKVVYFLNPTLVVQPADDDVVCCMLLVFVFRTALMEGWGQLTAWRQLFTDCYICIFFKTFFGTIKMPQKTILQLF